MQSQLPAPEPIDWLRLFGTSFLFTMLCVLLVFMTILPIPRLMPYIDIPAAWSGSKSPEAESDITISIGPDGTLFLANTLVDADALERQLTVARSRRDPPTVRVRVDRTARFQFVRRVVLVARRAGFERVTFMVRQPYAWHDDGLALDLPAEEDTSTVWPAILVAATCLAGAVIVRFVRRPASPKPGCIGWLLILAAALALVFVWSTYFPSCPRGMWC